MATTDILDTPPADLLARFLPSERPSFKLLQSDGDIRMWSSQTSPEPVNGIQRQPSTHHHITLGEKSSYGFISDSDEALQCFRFQVQAAQHQGRAVR